MFAFLLALACAKLPPTHHGPGFDDLRGQLASEGVERAPTVVVADLPAPPLPPARQATEIETRLLEGQEHLGEPTALDPENQEHAAFLRNDYVGAVRFGGGLIRTGETALEVRARFIEFSAQAELRAQAVAWLDDTAHGLLVEAKLPELQPSAAGAAGAAGEASAASVAPTIARKAVRGANDLDGRDNLNLPRGTIEPMPMPPSESGARWLLVPFLRGYTMHNGGWFLGQEWGTPGGARIEVLTVLYDRRSGQPVWWQLATGRHLEEMKAQPSRAQMDQYLLWAEDQVEGQLSKGFLK
jgi:hypothetical protein